MAVFAWREFLRWAEQMATNPQAFRANEALRRSAASRAYYACYHEAEAVALARGFVHSSNNNHAHLVKWLRSQRDQRLCTMGGTLATLKAYRVHADYYNNRFSPHRAQQTLRQARTFMTSAQQFSR